MVKQADHNSPRLKGQRGGRQGRGGAGGRIYIFTILLMQVAASTFGQICNGFFSKVTPLYFFLVRSPMTVWTFVLVTNWIIKCLKF